MMAKRSVVNDATRFESKDVVYIVARSEYRAIEQSFHSYHPADRPTLEAARDSFSRRFTGSVYPFGVAGSKLTLQDMELIDTPLKVDDWLSDRICSLEAIREESLGQDGDRAVWHANLYAGVVRGGCMLAGLLGVKCEGYAPDNAITLADEYTRLKGIRNEVRKAYPYVIGSTASAPAIPIKRRTATMWIAAIADALQRDPDATVSQLADAIGVHEKSVSRKFKSHPAIKQMWEQSAYRERVRLRLPSQRTKRHAKAAQ